MLNRRETTTALGLLLLPACTPPEPPPPDDLEINGAIADGSGTMCGASGGVATETGGDEECECRGGDLEGHIFRVRPNALPLPPLSLGQSVPVELSFRLFGTSEALEISTYSVTHYVGAKLGDDMELVETPENDDVEFAQVLVGSGVPQSGEVADVVSFDPKPGMNILEWEVEYAGGEERRLLALVVAPPEGAPQITHVGTGTGPISGQARVSELVTVTGFGFGDSQAELGFPLGQVLFGASQDGTGGVPSGTVLRWSDTRIEVKVPTGSHAAVNDENLVVSPPLSVATHAYPYTVLPGPNAPAFSFKTCQFVGEGQFESLLRYTKDADIADLDHDGDLDIFSPVSAPANAKEQGDVIFINRIQSESDTTWTAPLSLQTSFQRVTNDGESNFCGQDEHTTLNPVVYESTVADVDNDGDLDIIAPRGTTACEDEDGNCDDMNWIRLSMNQAASSSSYEGDFFFRDESETRIFTDENDAILSPLVLQERVYDDVDVADIDADGDLDLLFGNRDRTTGLGLTDVKHPNLILVNKGGLQGGSVGHFMAQEVGVAEDVSHDARFFDYDQDGDQDVLLLMECVGFCNGDDMGPSFVVLRNDVIDGNQAGDDFPIEFTDVTGQVTGIETTVDGIVSGVITDLDGDGYPEAVLIHNFLPGETIILRNDAGALSVEKFDIAERAYSITAVDINLDGYPDIVTSTTLESSWPHIFLNDGTGSFEQPAVTAGNASPWFDPNAQAKVAGDPTVEDYEVSPNFNQNLAADIGDLDGDGLLDYYFSQSEGLNGLIGVNPKADEDRIYLGGDGCL